MKTVTPTVADVLHDAVRRLAPVVLDEARLEAELLLCHVLGIDRTRLLAALAIGLSSDEVASFSALLERRLSREPLSYITGWCEFYGIEIACSREALIPRPETEMLVDFVLGEVAARGSALRVIDIGTGSGAISVAIVVNLRELRIRAVDASAEALRLATANAARHGVAGRIEFAQDDLLHRSGEFDVIVANLPYVSEDQWPVLEPEIREYEPRSALVGGPRGTEVIERLLDEAPSHLADTGSMAIEIGDLQGAAVSSYARTRFRGAQVDVLKDLAGLDRVVVVRRAAGS